MFSFGQNGSKGSLQGSVSNNKGEPVPFANAVLYSLPDSSLVTGAASDADGNFNINNLNEGKYYVTIQSIGFASHTISDITISSGNKNVNLGSTTLQISTQQLNDVVITGKRSTLTFENGMKVLNVGSDITNLGGTAVDAVKKLPAVQVDYEGNVSIRGNGNFKVLINGKPTTLTGQEELEKIPVNMIEKIELITNASAEYNPEGASVILNVITVKQSINGLNGMVESSYNINTSHSAGFRLGYMFDKVSINTGFNYDNNQWKYRNEFYQTTYNSSGQTDIDRTALGDFINEGKNYVYSLGIDYSPDTNNFISFSGNFTFTDRVNEMDNDYSEQFLNTAGTTYTNSLAYRIHKGPQYSLNGTYERYFSSKEHKLSVNAYYFGFSQNHDNSIYISNTDSDWNKLSQQSYYSRINDVVRSDMRLSCKYIMPIKERYKLNTGYEFILYNRTDASVTDTDFPPSDISIYDTIPVLNGDYTRNVHAAYATFEGTVGKFGYNIGVRAEYYMRTAKLNVEATNWNTDFVQLYPSSRLSYNMENEKELALSYSKHTFRPYSWMVFKIPTYHNKSYVYLGNSYLEPMYSHNAELSFQKRWDGFNLYSELFYSKNEKSIQTLFVPDSNGVRAGYPVNIDWHYSGGSSTMLTFSKLKWLNVQQGFDVYYSELTHEKMYSSLSYNISTKVNINIKDYVSISMNANYYGASASAQGEEKGMLFSDIGLSKKLFKNRATFAVTMWDPFKLTSFDRKTSGTGYSDRYYYFIDYLNINFYFAYRFNNYKNGGSNNSGANPSFLTQ